MPLVTLTIREGKSSEFKSAVLVPTGHGARAPRTGEEDKKAVWPLSIRGTAERLFYVLSPENRSISRKGAKDAKEN